MPKPSIKGALSSSVAAEQKKVQDKFARAEALLESPASKEEAKIESEPIAKVVREAFTIPGTEHEKIGDIQKFMLSNAVAVSKSEVVRAGLALLVQADDTTRLAVFEQLERVKTGRPKTV